MGRENFNSTLGSVLALAGSAVGLGNIWRFPYMVNEYGGGAFLLVYVACIIIVALPIMISEFVVGRHSHKGAYGAVKALEPRGHWEFFGTLVVLIPFATLCYYCVIGGWTLDYFLKSCLMEFRPGIAPDEIESMFGALVTNPWKPVLFDGIFLLVTAMIIILGVSKGIEKFSKVMMPLLFFVMILIAIRTLTLPGAGEGVRYLFKPDFSKITPSVCLAAMGQAFYSLSIGMGIMITYSSYLDRSANLTKTAALTIGSDFVFAVIAACAIIPALFAFGMPSGQGTGLVFKTLPAVFSQMPLGRLISIVFFFAVLLAALTSSMSLFEVGVSWLMEQKHISRHSACTYIFLAALIIGALCALSFGPLGNFKIGGRILFDAFDYTIGNYLMPFAGLVLVIFVGWKLDPAIFREEVMATSSPAGRFWLGVLRFAVRFISPAAIIAIFLFGIL